MQRQLLKEAQKRWQAAEAFGASLYGLLDRTPAGRVAGLRVADETGVLTVLRYERTKVTTT